MMKLLLPLTLIWALSSTGEALVCVTCRDAACSTTASVTCPTGTMCITASIQAVSSGTPGQQIYKACAPPSLCPSTGSQTFSVNLGVSSALASASCCSTDNCNSVTLPYPAANSLQCHVCNPITSDCSSSVQCKGTEDRCFVARVTKGGVTSPAFGCASTNLCAAASSLGTLPFMQDAGNITSGPFCCGTSLCNTLTKITPTTTTTTPTTTTTTPTTTTTTPTTTTTTPTTTTTTPTTTTTTPTTTTTTPTTTTTTPTATTTTPTTTTTTPITTTTRVALVCVICRDAACSTTAPVTCPTGTMCITASIQAVSSGTPVQKIVKGCAPPSLCPSTGSLTRSVNLGFLSELASVTCCSTDNCNSVTLPYPVVPAANSLQCHVCNPFNSDCSSSVQCKGTEDRCLQASVRNGAGTTPIFGCASSNVCAAVISQKDAGSTNNGTACCETSLCNTLTTTTTTPPITATTSPTTTTTASDACCVRMGMLHLLIGLLIFI